MTYDPRDFPMHRGVPDPDCYCSEDDGPCEDHLDLLVSREGAAQRTADELVAVFLGDVSGLWEDARGTAPTGDHYDLAADYWQAVSEEGDRERERAEREGGFAYVSGWAPESGKITRADGSVYEWADGEMSQALSDAIPAGESDLADLGLSVQWDDGFIVYRLTGGPLADL